MDEEDREIIVVLPLKSWRTVVAHLEVGIYRDVQPILASIYAQVNPQVLTAREQASADAALTEQRAKEAAAAAASQPNGAADESPEPQPLSQAISLH